MIPSKLLFFASLIWRCQCLNVFVSKHAGRTRHLIINQDGALFKFINAEDQAFIDIEQAWYVNSCTFDGETFISPHITSMVRCTKTTIVGKFRYVVKTCAKNQIVNDETKQCEDLAGHGYPVCFIPARKCPNNYIGVLPHPHNEFFMSYLVCRPKGIVVADCEHGQRFDSLAKECVNIPDTVIRADSDCPEVKELRCHREGVYPLRHFFKYVSKSIPATCRHCYYICDAFNETTFEAMIQCPRKYTPLTIDIDFTTTKGTTQDANSESTISLLSHNFDKTSPDNADHTSSGRSSTIRNDFTIPRGTTEDDNIRKQNSLGTTTDSGDHSISSESFSTAGVHFTTARGTTEDDATENSTAGKGSSSVGVQFPTVESTTEDDVDNSTKSRETSSHHSYHSDESPLGTIQEILDGSSSTAGIHVTTSRSTTEDDIDKSMKSEESTTSHHSYNSDEHPLGTTHESTDDSTIGTSSSTEGIHVTASRNTTEKDLGTSTTSGESTTSHHSYHSDKHPLGTTHESTDESMLGISSSTEGIHVTTSRSTTEKDIDKSTTSGESTISHHSYHSDKHPLGRTHESTDDSMLGISSSTEGIHVTTSRSTTKDDVDKSTTSGESTTSHHSYHSDKHPLVTTHESTDDSMLDISSSTEGIHVTTSRSTTEDDIDKSTTSGESTTSHHSYHSDKYPLGRTHESTDDSMLDISSSTEGIHVTTSRSTTKDDVDKSTTSGESTTSHHSYHSDKHPLVTTHESTDDSMLDISSSTEGIHVTTSRITTEDDVDKSTTKDDVDKSTSHHSYHSDKNPLGTTHESTDDSMLGISSSTEGIHVTTSRTTTEDDVDKSTTSGESTISHHSYHSDKHPLGTTHENIDLTTISGTPSVGGVQFPTVRSTTVNDIDKSTTSGESTTSHRSYYSDKDPLVTNHESTDDSILSGSSSTEGIHVTTSRSTTEDNIDKSTKSGESTTSHHSYHSDKNPLGTTHESTDDSMLGISSSTEGIHVTPSRSTTEDDVDKSTTSGKSTTSHHSYHSDKNPLGTTHESTDDSMLGISSSTEGIHVTPSRSTTEDDVDKSTTSGKSTTSHHSYHSDKNPLGTTHESTDDSMLGISSSTEGIHVTPSRSTTEDDVDKSTTSGKSTTSHHSYHSDKNPLGTTHESTDDSMLGISSSTEGIHVTTSRSTTEEDVDKRTTSGESTTSHHSYHSDKKPLGTTHESTDDSMLGISSSTEGIHVTTSRSTTEDDVGKRTTSGESTTSHHNYHSDKNPLGTTHENIDLTTTSGTSSVGGVQLPTVGSTTVNDIDKSKTSGESTTSHHSYHSDKHPLGTTHESTDDSTLGISSSTEGFHVTTSRSTTEDDVDKSTTSGESTTSHHSYHSDKKPLGTTHENTDDSMLGISSSTEGIHVTTSRSTTEDDVDKRTTSGESTTSHHSYHSDKKPLGTTHESTDDSTLGISSSTEESHVTTLRSTTEDDVDKSTTSGESTISHHSYHSDKNPLGTTHENIDLTTTSGTPSVGGVQFPTVGSTTVNDVDKSTTSGESTTSHHSYHSDKHPLVTTHESTDDSTLGISSSTEGIHVTTSRSTTEDDVDKSTTSGESTTSHHSYHSDKKPLGTTHESTDDSMLGISSSTEGIHVTTSRSTTEDNVDKSTTSGESTISHHNYHSDKHPLRTTHENIDLTTISGTPSVGGDQFPTVRSTTVNDIDKSTTSGESITHYCDHSDKNPLGTTHESTDDSTLGISSSTEESHVTTLRSTTEDDVDKSTTSGERTTSHHSYHSDKNSLGTTHESIDLTTTSGTPSVSGVQLPTVRITTVDDIGNSTIPREISSHHSHHSGKNPSSTTHGSTDNPIFVGSSSTAGVHFTTSRGTTEDDIESSTAGKGLSHYSHYPRSTTDGSGGPTESVTQSSEESAEFPLSEDCESYNALPCPSVGLFRLNQSCSEHYKCVESKECNKILAVGIYRCPKCLKFNARTSKCELPQNVPECTYFDSSKGFKHIYYGQVRECTGPGRYGVPENCSLYYDCQETNPNTYSLIVKECDGNKKFNDETKQCEDDWSCPKPHSACNKKHLAYDKYSCERFYYCQSGSDHPTEELICPRNYVFNGEACVSRYHVCTEHCDLDL